MQQQSCVWRGHILLWHWAAAAWHVHCLVEKERLVDLILIFWRERAVLLPFVYLSQFLPRKVIFIFKSQEGSLKSFKNPSVFQWFWPMERQCQRPQCCLAMTTTNCVRHTLRMPFFSHWAPTTVTKPPKSPHAPSVSAELSGALHQHCVSTPFLSAALLPLPSPPLPLAPGPPSAPQLGTSQAGAQAVALWPRGPRGCPPPPCCHVTSASGCPVAGTRPWGLAARLWQSKPAPRWCNTGSILYLPCSRGNLKALDVFSPIPRCSFWLCFKNQAFCNSTHDS